LCYCLFDAVNGRFASAIDCPKLAASFRSRARQFKRVKGEECEARPLKRFNWQTTIETRFCVNGTGSKTVPKRLGGL
jgi:hypothetical protein